MKKVAIILSGCGVFDGSEIHEAVITMLSVEQNGAQYQCFAPDVAQMHVVNHLTGEVAEQESRNVLVEAARIARGEIKPVTELNADEFDALLLPGGFGAAKNLCDFAVNGGEASMNADVLAACQSFANEGKPAGYICISPAMIPMVYGQGAKATIGTDADTAAGVTALGGEHIECPVSEFVVDEARKVVSTPAYMLAGNISQAAEGIGKLVKQVLAMT
ncbi:isoprenoid biosynthesis protein ElbB [Thalassotalea euphylliae]|uniref:Glyoxalase n=1 Tax=Thalassotalea euphylliae TaxID=1655234 RepID=A0A3E0TUS1_9GAMM|nr:isoprenoid biosynthesis glyoxalase ElbB [Thalassotalea euphylliae]REL28426.1 isoprenoid biosynthesis protein ElbB [Thalassotalea euphylliae]